MIKSFIFATSLLIFSTSVFAEVEVCFTPSTDCEEKIIQRINKAQKIEIAVYAN